MKFRGNIDSVEKLDCSALDKCISFAWHANHISSLHVLRSKHVVAQVDFPRSWPCRWSRRSEPFGLVWRNYFINFAVRSSVSCFLADKEKNRKCRQTFQTRSRILWSDCSDWRPKFCIERRHKHVRSHQRTFLLGLPLLSFMAIWENWKCEG